MARSHRTLGPARDLVDTLCTFVNSTQPNTPHAQNYDPQIPSASLVDYDAEDSLPSTLPLVVPTQPPDYSSVELPVAHEVASFFADFKDTSEEIHRTIPPLSPPITALHQSCRSAIEFVTRQKQTVPEMASTWRLIAQIESNVPEHHRHVSNEFKWDRAFSTYASRARKWKAKQEGWRSVSIKTPLGTNTTGAFRSTLNLLLAQMDSAGGLKKRGSLSGGSKRRKKAFEGCCSADAMKSYATASRSGVHYYWSRHIL